MLCMIQASTDEVITGETHHWLVHQAQVSECDLKERLLIYPYI